MNVESICTPHIVSLDAQEPISRAALLMREAGIENVLQLDGGILKYFEATGGAHFEGRCFVFDQREALSYTLE